jgi:hypothetical protein
MRFVLALLYLGVITPIAVALRLLGFDPLGVCGGYRRPKCRRSPSHYRKPY